MSETENKTENKTENETGIENNSLLKPEIIKSLSPHDFGIKFVDLFKSLTGIKLQFNFDPDKPHIVTPLKSGESGVYAFLASVQDCSGCLKVGQAGANSKARWDSHHYTPNGATSSLPKSIEAKPKLFLNVYKRLNRKQEAQEFLTCLREIRLGICKKENKKKLRTWVENNTCRLEFVIPKGKQKYLINFLEGYLQWLLEPCYEGVQE